jgi:hypothetical protein
LALVWFFASVRLFAYQFADRVSDVNLAEPAGFFDSVVLWLAAGGGEGHALQAEQDSGMA